MIAYHKYDTHVVRLMALPAQLTSTVNSKDCFSHWTGTTQAGEHIVCSHITAPNVHTNTSTDLNKTIWIIDVQNEYKYRKFYIIKYLYQWRCFLLYSTLSYWIISVNFGHLNNISHPCARLLIIFIIQSIWIILNLHKQCKMS